MAYILVIDDDDQLRNMMLQMLKRDNHTVISASDGNEGIKLCAEKKPDLIITDIIMPNKDGIEMIMELTQAGNQTPIIAISGGRRLVTAEFNLESAELLGVSGVLSKPFTREQLRNAIDNALNS